MRIINTIKHLGFMAGADLDVHLPEKTFIELAWEINWCFGTSARSVPVYDTTPLSIRCAGGCTVTVHCQAIQEFPTPACLGIDSTTVPVQ